MNEQVLKNFPVFNTDEEAEEFVANVDLSGYDFSGFKPMSFELKGQSGVIAKIA